MTKKVLYPHQEEGVEYLFNGGTALFMEMRTGKTLTTIRGIKKLVKESDYQPFPVLIVCPKSVMETWRAELTGDGVPEEWVQVIDGSRMKRLNMLRHLKQFNIVNYEMMEGYNILSRRFGFVVYDESIRLGNMSAKVTKYCVRNYNPNIRYVALSGAPASESSIQLVSQYLAVQGNFMGFEKYAEYLQTHWRYIDRSYTWKPLSKKHLEVVQQYNLETAHCVTMKDVGLGSEKLYSIRHLAPNKKQELLFERVKNSQYYMKEGKEVEFNALTRTTFEQLIAAGLDPFNGNELIADTKIKDVLQYFIDNKEPLLVLSRFKSLIHHALKLFEKSRIKTALIDGDVDKDSREQIRRDFQDGKYHVVLAQVKTVKMGLDFSRATTIFYLSNSFSQDDRSQSEQRATHVQKTDPVQIVDVCTEGSMDDIVVELLKNKMEVSTQYIQERLLDARTDRSN